MDSGKAGEGRRPYGWRWVRGVLLWTVDGFSGVLDQLVSFCEFCDRLGVTHWGSRQAGRPFFGFNLILTEVAPTPCLLLVLRNREMNVLDCR